ncbi:MAG: peptidoglycan DD-metalloendopeptidase family protein [Pseudomonadota bacterium]
MNQERKTSSFKYLSLIATMLLASCQQQASVAREHRYGSSAGGGSLGIHTLKAKENLWTVAQAYHVDLRDLLDMNKLQAPYHLATGTRLKIPAPQTYRVQARDTIYNVSRLFNTTTTDVARLNHLQAPYILKQGQVVYLPTHHMAVSNNRASPIKPEQFISAPVARVDRVDRVELFTLPHTPVIRTATPQVPHNESVGLVTKDNGKGFLRPVEGPILSGFGQKQNGLYNDGVNYRTIRGAPVRAAKSGEVVYAGHDIEGYGNLILIRHAEGYVTAYAHLDKVLSHKGDKVQRGQVIGKAGTSGNVGTPQLHFEIRKGRDVLDPTLFSNQNT